MRVSGILSRARAENTSIISSSKRSLTLSKAGFYSHRNPFRYAVLCTASSASTKSDSTESSAATTTPNPAVDSSKPRSSFSDLELSSPEAQELRENGFRSTRRTKLICTIGPSCCSEEMLSTLASNGMNVARLNLSHGDHQWHREIIARIRKLNKDKGFSVAIMMDTEGGSEVHLASVTQPRQAVRGEEIILTIREPSATNNNGKENLLSVSFGGFVEDVLPGDVVSLDGGMVALQVQRASGPDLICSVLDPGLILPRASITVTRGGKLVRAKNSMLPVLSAKDWMDVDLAIEQQVDFIGVSFVKTADVLYNLRSYVASRSDRVIELVAKIESFDSVGKNLPAIIDAADAVMVARGDLGAQIPLEDVPSVQREIVVRCRQRGKPVIVASQLLESMHTLPTPTRAEVADISDCVRQKADALMLSGESAVGAFPDRALDVLRTVATRMELWCREEPPGSIALPQLASTPDGRTSEELCAAAAAVSNNLNARAIFCFTKRGFMANFMSRMRPDAPIFAFCDSQETRQRLNLRWGVIPFRIDLQSDPEANVQRTFALLKKRELISTGDLVVVVSDVRQEGMAAPVSPEAVESGTGVVRSVQVRRVP
jgi:pyruvate kinase